MLLDSDVMVRCYVDVYNKILAEYSYRFVTRHSSSNIYIILFILYIATTLTRKKQISGIRRVTGSAVYSNPSRNLALTHMETKLIFFVILNRCCDICAIIHGGGYAREVVCLGNAALDSRTAMRRRNRYAKNIESATMIV